jgi:hypothetical protein
MANCWICGKLADSAEHKIKKSDIVRIHGTGSYKNGEVLLHQKESFTPIQGSNSKLVKYNKILCSDCNNSFSQPFDKAYDRFIDYICENKALVLKRRFVNFQEVYGDNFADEQRNLYKYFVKSFGCRLAHYGDPIPVDLPKLLYKDRFKTGLRISFSVNEDKLLGPEWLDKMIGNGDLYMGQHSEWWMKLLSKIGKSSIYKYEYSEYFRWLHIFYWYNVPTDGSFGAPWVANSQYIYLGSHEPLSIDEREKLLERIKNEENLKFIEID